MSRRNASGNLAVREKKPEPIRVAIPDVVRAGAEQLETFELHKVLKQKPKNMDELEKQLLIKFKSEFFKLSSFVDEMRWFDIPCTDIGFVTKTAPDAVLNTFVPKLQKAGAKFTLYKLIW